MVDQPEVGSVAETQAPTTTREKIPFVGGWDAMQAADPSGKSLRKTNSIAPNSHGATVTKHSISDLKYLVTGMDGIWHNIYEDPEKGFAWTMFRKWFEDEPDDMLARINRHVDQGLYSVVSLSISKHSVAVVCKSMKPLEDWPEGVLLG